MKLLWATAPALLLWAMPAAAHPGGLNAEGCHNNRKTGDYHCHGALRASRASRANAAVPRLFGMTPVRRAGGASFGSCAAARAAGYARMRSGEPGYAPHLDRDGDGIACE